ncbi:propionate CoA-transferase [Clostridiales bacterium COT073_COT-073]|nr:propionate CoA-transferase [Clostridiales bacterium COT073_COT-073]
MSKKMSLQDAVNLIQDGDNVAISGFMLMTVPRELYLGIAERFQNTGHPQGITVMHAAGNGNNKDQGIIDMTYEGLITRYITGHFANNTKMIELVNNNKVAAYNFPQGVIAHMYRAAAAGKPGEITRIGLHTFCDPRVQGGKMNEATTEDLVELIDVLGEEQLLYKVPKLNIGLIRGTTADEHGNITLEEEGAPVDALDVAMAVKACGGKVIAQVKNYVSSNSIERSKVVIPGNMVDAIVVCENPLENHRQTPGSFFDPVLTGQYKLNNVGFASIALDERKVIARRAAMELSKNSVVNLGIGIPESVAAIATEEGIGEDLLLTIESGLVGGVPTGGGNFGCAINAWAALPMTTQFDYYNGGNLSLTCLGFAEVDQTGNVNVSRFGKRIAGCGGLIDISQSTHTVVFCGTMTAGGLEVAVQDGKMQIIHEGQKIKFKKSVEQITFSSTYSNHIKQTVLFVTERCVFTLTANGLMLTEVAPGIDVEKNILPYMEFKPLIADPLKVMDPRLFMNVNIGLKEMLQSK